MTNKKEEIINWLTNFPRMSTSQVTAMIGLPYKNAKRYLEELKNENKIIEEKETNATYWRLKK